MDEEKKDFSLTEDQAQQMPEETKAAEEVQSAEEAAAEVQQEETVGAETVTEEAETAEEPAAEPVEPALVQTAVPAKSGSNIVGIIVGLLVFIGVLALCWKMVGPVGEVHADKGIAYAKDNNLYIYDLETTLMWQRKAFPPAVSTTSTIPHGVPHLMKTAAVCITAPMCGQTAHLTCITKV